MTRNIPRNLTMSKSELEKLIALENANMIELVKIINAIIGDGSPKAVFPTLFDLEEAYPDGELGIFLVEQNGHWYFFNGVEWIDGGIYLATGMNKIYAANVIYNGVVPVNNVEDAIDDTWSRISRIIAQSGTSSTEVVDARGGFPVLGDRLNNINANLLDIAYDVKNYNTFAMAVDAATANSGNLLIPPGTHVVNENVTIPRNVTLLFANGGKLTVPTGVTLTINGGIDAGLFHIFDGEGVVLGSPIIQESFPEWFGGKADMSTDNTKAFVDALKISSVLRLSDGYYNVSDEIAISKTVTIKGNGCKQSIVRTMNVTKGAFVLTGTDSNIINVGFATASTPTAGIMIRLAANGIRLNNVYINRCFTGIECSGGAGYRLDGITIDLYANIGLHCFSGCNDIMLTSFLFNAGEAAGALGGIRLADRVEAFMATNGDILGGAYCMTTDASVNTIGNRPAYNKFTNVFFDSAINGVLLSKTVSTRFSNCWFSNRPNNGIVLRSCDDVTFTNSEFTNNGGSGVYLGNTNTRTKFIGCSFMNNNSTNSNSNGLTIESGTKDFIVQGCTASNSLGFPGNQMYGVIVNAGNSDRYIIDCNLLSGNVTGGVSDGGTGTNKRVSSNY